MNTTNNLCLKSDGAIYCHYFTFDNRHVFCQRAIKGSKVNKNALMIEIGFFQTLYNRSQLRMISFRPW